jgi:superfamily II DNA or RNA helicase
MTVNTSQPQLAVAPSGALYLHSASVETEKTRSDKARRSSADSALWDILIDQAISPAKAHSCSEDLLFWGSLATLVITKVRELPDPDAELASAFDGAILSESEEQGFVERLPIMQGVEYCSLETVRKVWLGVRTRLTEQIISSKQSVQEFLQSRNELWKIVGRVFFHLAENRSDLNHPFAFMATYTARITAHGKIQHVPLGRAVEESGKQRNKSALLAILLPVHKVAAQSQFISRLVESSQIYHPQPWTQEQAFEFLQEIELFESFGIGIRVPNWWSSNKLRHPTLRITVGEEKTSTVGLDALLDFSVECVVDGKRISEQELNQLLAAGTGLVRFKGEWIEVDRDKLLQVAQQLKGLRKTKEVSLVEGLRLLANTSINSRDGALSSTLSDTDESAVAWREIRGGAWLRETLEALRNPESCPTAGIAGLHATLRPYQEAGVRWLWYLYSLGLGGCLADDMGLGKTLQIIAFLLMLKTKGELSKPALLVVPASLIGNWKAECARFAPSIKVLIAHSSETSATQVATEAQSGFAKWDVVLTTYSGLLTQKWASEVQWRIVVIDEAQAIKNSGTKQSRAVRATKGAVRFALTGTPVENSLGDLWSLFDFINPGLLGTTNQFSQFVKADKKRAVNQYGRLRSLIQPYLLRRLKTDKRIICDLPDKTEVKVYCGLSAKQVALYQQSVQELAQAVKEYKAGIQRKGIVLSYLMRFKQICNHPAQWLGHGGYEADGSGKVERLLEICDEIFARQDKVLVFSQFREVLDPLAAILQERVSKGSAALPSFVLHGDTAIKDRQKLVTAFQNTPGAAVFLLSLKAGGTGLNLTAASHVIHFDRWWNPAVENQATDRAFRIGQKRNVLVHKFICSGTVEERIDELISEKQQLASQVLSDKAERLITEMNDDELLKFVSLDFSKVSIT